MTSTALIWLGRNGRYCLIAGLVAGFLLPDLAQSLRPWIGEMVAVLLCVTGMRVGARAVFDSMGNIGGGLIRIGCLQVIAPVAVIWVLSVTGLLAYPIGLAVALLLAAPSLTGAPNFAVMIGQDPAPGMRLLVIGTALFPFTALPVFLILDPAGEGVWGALGLSLWLLGAILVAVGVGFATQGAIPTLQTRRTQGILDGIAAVLLAVVVVGLMSAIGPLLRSDPLGLAYWVVAGLAINLVLVLTTLWVGRRFGIAYPEATAIYAGNRNIALFLLVLPEAYAAPMMIFIGCYQIPMYLTPFVLSRFARD